MPNPMRGRRLARRRYRGRFLSATSSSVPPPFRRGRAIRILLRGRVAHRRVLRTSTTPAFATERGPFARVLVVVTVVQPVANIAHRVASSGASAARASVNNASSSASGVKPSRTVDGAPTAWTFDCCDAAPACRNGSPARFSRRTPPSPPRRPAGTLPVVRPEAAGAPVVVVRTGRFTCVVSNGVISPRRTISSRSAACTPPLDELSSSRRCAPASSVEAAELPDVGPSHASALPWSSIALSSRCLSCVSASSESCEGPRRSVQAAARELLVVTHHSPGRADGRARPSNRHGTERIPSARRVGNRQRLDARPRVFGPPKRRPRRLPPCGLVRTSQHELIHITRAPARVADVGVV